MSHRTGQVAETPAHGVAMSADHPARTFLPATWRRQSCRRARIQAGFGPGSSFSTLPDKLERTNQEPALLLDHAVPPDVDAIFKKRRGIVAGQHRKSHMASPLLPAVSFRFKTKLQEKNRIASDRKSVV